jgi:hypothetical protein
VGSLDEYDSMKRTMTGKLARTCSLMPCALSTLRTMEDDVFVMRREGHGAATTAQWTRFYESYTMRVIREILIGQNNNHRRRPWLSTSPSDIRRMMARQKSGPPLDSHGLLVREVLLLPWFIGSVTSPISYFSRCASSITTIFGISFNWPSNHI